MEKKIILSGIQPSGVPTLGNYVGALRNWKLMQDDDKFCYYCVANMHALTVRQNADELRERSMSMAALLIACGINPEISPLFIQSDVMQHAQLNWVLACNTYMGELNRMTQFKDKSAKHADNINAGLFTYPVLMAGDILLYQADLVPGGHDQKQHVELARNIAIRFNNAYGETFKVPEPYIPKIGGRVMSLTDPEKKMSKSDTNPNAYISILDEPAVILKKFKRAVTDSEGRIAYEEGRHGVNNLLSIYCAMTGKTMEETVAMFEGNGYGVLKTAVAEAVISELRPVQEEYSRILADRGELEAILRSGAERASETAEKTIDLVYRKVGLR